MSPLRLGAALRTEHLPMHLTWLLDGQRDLEIQEAIGWDVLDGDWQAHARRLRTLLEGHTGRRGVHGPFIDLTISARDPLIRAAVQTRLRQGLDFAAAVGGTHMVIHSPFSFMGNAYLPTSAPDFGRADFIENVRETLAPVIAQAEQQGCTLVIENIRDRLPGLLLALVRALDSDAVRMSLDTGHAYLHHITQGAPPVDYWVREAGPLLAHVHLQDNDAYTDRHWTPGDGNIPWRSVMQTLAALPEQPRLILELADSTEIPRAAAFFVEAGWAV
ncbi:MAG: sugar phosphate isomerase/epimerase [Anaerolineae bacterium]|nr:sugar phosphate isomerase/epimerase [Anaerolineae bacterium]